MRTVLQVPMPIDLRNRAEAVSLDMGFSSLQDVVRFMLAKLAKKEIRINIEQFPAVRLSRRNEKRYERMIRDFEAGENVRTFTSVKDLMSDLNA